MVTVARKAAWILVDMKTIPCIISRVIEVISSVRSPTITDFLVSSLVNCLSSATADTYNKQKKMAKSSKYPPKSKEPKLKTSALKKGSSKVP